MSVLLLNASFEPLRVIPMRRALTLMVGGRAELIARDGERVVRTAGGNILEAPAVLRLSRMVHIPWRSVPLTRQTLRARDKGRCQVTGCDRKGDSVDHIKPKSRGGGHEWTNVALMCRQHNSRKSDRLLSELNWTLKAEPHAPTGMMVLVDQAGRRTEWEPFLGEEESAA
ncbi:MAG: HNH endonuclease [Actinomycetia bacterium]|nr:HNH endonuclease [Actinomycetes bacterium]